MPTLSTTGPSSQLCEDCADDIVAEVPMQPWRLWYLDSFTCDFCRQTREDEPAFYLPLAIKKEAAMAVMDQLEKDTEEAFVKWCELNGHLCLKLEEKNVRGFPDRTVITALGSVLFIEFKRPGGGKLSPQQIDRLSTLRHHAQDALVTDDLQEAIDFVEARKAPFVE